MWIRIVVVCGEKHQAHNVVYYYNNDVVNHHVIFILGFTFLQQYPQQLQPLCLI
jgi:hypothetical protein